ncbi:hypothetical protein FE257_005627 [Aspergillus nanangensis]|uniref:Uncharacterized protein n=1 Tax=Aspergillus nanangensis TaxID=2582783 RepID=A0AAD4GWQ8_ASPNN|nr:hypothetical protein FE257_005627 [Aspergillus nanangensis]
MSGSSRFGTQPHVQRERPSSLQVDSRHAPAASPHLRHFLSGKLPDSRVGHIPLMDDAIRGVTGSETTANIPPRNSASHISTTGPSTNVASPSIHLSGRSRDHRIPDTSQLQSGHWQMSAGESTERQQAEPNTGTWTAPKNGPYPNSQPHSPSKAAAGQKRTAGGLVKPASSARYPRSIGVENSTPRRRSRSIGSLSHGSRIAALSVHLRTRLSYAAAQVEKSRKAQNAQTQVSLDFLKKESPTLTPTPAPPLIDSAQAEYDPSSDQRLVGSPMSAPDPSHNPLQGTARNSPIARSENFSPFSLNDAQLKFQESQRTLQVPRLAPPADIVSSTTSNNPRRRPNPNEPRMASFFPPLHRHRRHHSQHEIGAHQPPSSSETILVPGTPPFGASAYNSITSQNNPTQQQSQTQNTAMEQDAIETLLFMSSPGNSGYRSNSQNSQNKNNQIRRNIAAAMDPAPRHSRHQISQPEGKSSHSSAPPRNPVGGLEAQAGDEIDRMLDQMDSDSEDERGFVSRFPPRVKLGSAPVDSSRARNALSGS